MRILAGVGVLGVLVVGCGEDKKESKREPAEIVTVVKNKGDAFAWWVRFEQGIEAAASEFNVVASMEGPPAGSAEESIVGQIEIIDGLIERGVDAIGVVPNDPGDERFEAVLQKARDAGIVAVTHEAPDIQNADWDIETVDNDAFAEANAEALASALGGEGEFAMFIGGAGHAYWADVSLEYLSAEYPNLTLVTLDATDEGTALSEGAASAQTADAFDDYTACSETQAKCNKATELLLAAHPELKGILAFGSNGPVGAATYLESITNTDVKVVGVAAPSDASAMLHAGYIAKVHLWDPAESARALVAVANRAVAEESLSGLALSGLGTAVVNQQTRDVVFNRFLEITPENVDDLVAELGF